MCSDETYTLTFFFINDTATTEIYTLSLHDALPILTTATEAYSVPRINDTAPDFTAETTQGTIHFHDWIGDRSEEHTSELQSHSDLVCRLLLEKKKYRSQENQIH